MAGLSKQNQEMKSQVGDQKVSSISEIMGAEPPTFSRISILDNEEIFPFLKPIFPRRIRKRARPSSEYPENPSKKIKQELSKSPTEEKDHTVDTGSIRMHMHIMQRSFDKVQMGLRMMRKEQEKIYRSMIGIGKILNE